MLLGESDITAIVEHLGDKVQFYNAKGRADNLFARRRMRDALRSYIGTPAAKSAERFELVKIGFEKVFVCSGPGILDHPQEMAKRIVSFADAVLAEMERIHDTAKQPGIGMEKPGAETPDAK